ncbi:tRNA nucleotidyltransferase [Rhodoblastus acidophilus]|uniref:tRNA nucleotidyltransferase n=1 Tax=Candidatus Rhodoblastus alkanivorans TaxID=2954117 RepID=A0ABS9Z630_9HYPH|nr:tRNA nucleotidyltransferase [Candidatus Rhodoblastus alkanivorans]MCI4679129.1 tRNA nucleotidyltransferase [Candidatus Rhodoblastus alkanivorans]MCI4683125.1 tRNA nucleotidyltransferase [Candidatus Rhodoblastus alkanivorans]MDI4640436.1 tRNA nucleotidyltransferase [Rhodoblastus acidophilus]
MPPLLNEIVQTDPALGILRHAALLAEAEGAPDDEELDLLYRQTDAGFLLDLAPARVWPELARGLMGSAPAKMLGNLRECGALEQILPEVEALFGVPLLSDQPGEVDLGEHVLASLDEASFCEAPLAVRFALLTMHVGKADSPKEHLPVHYKHIERGCPRVEAIAARFAAPADCRELALTALAESERVHRVSKMRAGPVALMLERLGAFDAPDVFARLMTVCACDYRAFPGRTRAPYPKAALLETARAACADIRDDGTEATREARAIAIARAFQSLRWADED